MLQQDTTAGEIEPVKNIWLSGCAGSKLISFLLVCPLFFRLFYSFFYSPFLSMLCTIGLHMHQLFLVSEENHSKERNYCSNWKPLEHWPYTQTSLRFHSEVSLPNLVICSSFTGSCRNILLLFHRYNQPVKTVMLRP